ncbi:hypothetical protein DHD05_22600, partial [Arenibacter sp. N53]|uniref:T9SS type A sorting domain-containing protein n=1 Tax=Arenibacter TaxID=178469 RepID=UPI0012FFF8EC
NNEVRAITIDVDGLVYVGGNFDAAGGNTAPRIAVWDGTNWGTLGTGTSGFVQAMAITQDYIYAGGNFAIAGNVTANRIARWDRSSLQWETLGQGLSGNVNALAHDGSYLYAGGNFQTASDQENINKVVNNIARWSEIQGWQALGNGTAVGTDKPVNKLVFDGQMSSLYVGGTFNLAGEDNAGNIAIWGLDLGCINNIIPEYTINGSTDNGLNEITLQEGSEIILSILPKDIDFSIELVDGSIILGDYTINNLTESDQGTYTFTTPEGCIETLQIIVESSNVDSDNDGVPDEIDQCPNTAPLEIVDNTGCTAAELPIDNYIISATGLNCRASGNGRISISSNNKNIESSATVIGANLNKSYTFIDNLEITDLQSGQYEICLTNNRFPNYNSCSNIFITEPEELLVTSTLNKENNVLTLKMSGAKNYKINHNGLNFYTKENTMNLVIEDNVNVIQVSTDEICQGTHEEIISLKSSIVYPNPFDKNLNITAFTKSTERVEILIYSSLGVLISSNVYDYQDGVVQIETPYLSAGVYYVLVYNGETLDSHKIVKQ